MERLILKVKDSDGRDFETLFIININEVYQILSLKYKSEKRLNNAELIIIRNNQEIQITYDNKDSRNLLLSITYDDLCKEISDIIANSTSIDEELTII